MKLGLIAMSGVRVVDPELLSLGLTLPGFVERSRVIASLPSLGLLTLAGLTPKEIDLEYLDVPDARSITSLPGAFDAVAISSFSAQIDEAYTLADRYRQRGTKVILGGLHVTACPEEALKHADAIVIGEGEPLWPEVLSDLSRDALKQLYDARNLSFDLSAAPMPRFDLLDVQHYNRIPVQTQRGCPFNCKFCAASVRLTPHYKLKPIHKVVGELREVIGIWRRPFIEFADDNSFVNKRHSRELVRALIPLELRWFTETDVSIADDVQLLELLRESGCKQVLIGLETPQPNSLDGLELRTNWKFLQRDRYLQAIEIIQKHGISVNGCFVLGLDGSDCGSFAAIEEFVRTSGLHEVQITIQTPFPGTPLYTELLASARILEPKAWHKCTLFDVNFIPNTMSVAELSERFRLLMRSLYSDTAVSERNRRFRQCLRRASGRRIK